MLLQVIQSQVNNENNEVIRRIYSSTRTKYSWETKLGADFLILAGWQSREILDEANVIKHAVADTSSPQTQLSVGIFTSLCRQT